jgi:16S rRNA (guanine(966)-N(2))-methyltransferase RsmD
MRTRPTPERLREALFNVLAPRIEGCVFLDAYAGCGSVGIEALSRGARRAVFIEQNRAAVRVIHENLDSLGASERATVAGGRVTALLERFEAGVVFLDPPYEQEREYGKALEILGRTPPALAIVQHASRFALEEMYGRLRRTRVLRQGDNSLSFFEPA